MLEKMHPTLGIMVRDNGEVLVPKSGVHKYEDVNAYWRAWRLHKKGLN